MNCAHCRKTLASHAALACSNCKTVSYCDAKCQQSHWKNGGHRVDCIGADPARPDNRVMHITSPIAQFHRRYPVLLQAQGHSSMDDTATVRGGRMHSLRASFVDTVQAFIGMPSGGKEKSEKARKQDEDNDPRKARKHDEDTVPADLPNEVWVHAMQFMSINDMISLARVANRFKDLNPENFLAEMFKNTVGYDNKISLACRAAAQPRLTALPVILDLAKEIDDFGVDVLKTLLTVSMSPLTREKRRDYIPSTKRDHWVELFKLLVVPDFPAIRPSVLLAAAITRNTAVVEEWIKYGMTNMPEYMLRGGNNLGVYRWILTMGDTAMYDIVFKYMGTNMFANEELMRAQWFGVYEFSPLVARLLTGDICEGLSDTALRHLNGPAPRYASAIRIAMATHNQELVRRLLLISANVITHDHQMYIITDTWPGVLWPSVSSDGLPFLNASAMAIKLNEDRLLKSLLNLQLDYVRMGSTAYFDISITALALRGYEYATKDDKQKLLEVALSCGSMAMVKKVHSLFVWNKWTFMPTAPAITQITITDKIFAWLKALPEMDLAKMVKVLWPTSPIGNIDYHTTELLLPYMSHLDGDPFFKITSMSQNALLFDPSRNALLFDRPKVTDAQRDAFLRQAASDLTIMHGGGILLELCPNRWLLDNLDVNKIASDRAAYYTLPVGPIPVIIRKFHHKLTDATLTAVRNNMRDASLEIRDKLRDVLSHLETVYTERFPQMEQ